MTKDKILDAAFEIAREQGLDGLTARNLAQRLNCSTQPIYSVYGNMEEVKNDTYSKAVDYALLYTSNYEDGDNSPALNFAIGFLYFSKNEKQLFRVVYLSGHKTYDVKNEKLIGEELMAAYMRHSSRLKTISDIRLRHIFLQLYIFLIGIGTMINSDTLDLDIHEATNRIREMYETILFKEGLSKCP